MKGHIHVPELEHKYKIYLYVQIMARDEQKRTGYFLKMLIDKK